MTRFLRRPISARRLAARVLTAAFATLAVAPAAVAGPPPGERWSDHAWGRGKPGSSAHTERPVQRSSTRVPTAGGVRFGHAPAYPSPGYGPRQLVLPSGRGTWVFESDGVYRWHPAVRR